MKRFILFLITGIIAASVAFTDDAAILPAGSLRVSVDASTGFIRKAWDSDGRKIDAPEATIIGAAPGVAYGFTEWFTAVLEWSPGVTDTDTAIDIGNDGDSAEEIYEGLSDFSVKAQFQIIGDNAPLKSERFRMTLTSGIIAPFPGIDDKDASGNHAWGAGSGVSADVFIIDDLFVNAAGDFYCFPFDNKSKTNNDWELTIEAGPHYSAGIGGAQLGLALPVHWKVSRGNGGGVSSYMFALCPTLALKLTRPFAINIEVEYKLPLFGKNEYAAHTITIKTPMYFNFAKNREEEL